MTCIHTVKQIQNRKNTKILTGSAKYTGNGWAKIVPKTNNYFAI